MRSEDVESNNELRISRDLHSYQLEVETKCEQLGYAPTVSPSAAVLLFKAGFTWIEVKFYEVQGRD